MSVFWMVMRGFKVCMSSPCGGVAGIEKLALSAFGGARIFRGGVCHASIFLYMADKE